MVSHLMIGVLHWVAAHAEDAPAAAAFAGTLERARTALRQTLRDSAPAVDHGA